ncbi:hypothetical protein TEA_026182 [Camellia sinensis var. sinensis]|uniref:IST1-like protein n=1 Tax=Camellia sinensis var. sinensis TaxID=542762 RepID=A0A4S4F0M2_CAMSN|nr:hypothetical protein TEA_026182 [Camellia sinensis var. sinensis]
MSLLNQLFNRGVLGPKCKTCLNLAISRFKLLQNKRDRQLKLMRREIAQFLQAGQEAIARIRVEHVIREQNIWAAYEILEMFCEFVLARVPILDSQRQLGIWQWAFHCADEWCCLAVGLLLVSLPFFPATGGGGGGGGGGRIERGRGWWRYRKGYMAEVFGDGCSSSWFSVCDILGMTLEIHTFGSSLDVPIGGRQSFQEGRECPSELREAVASIIFAGPRCSDVPDLLHVRNLFAAKYGKEFISAASELRPDTSVNRTIVEKLSVSAPSVEIKLNVLKDIAQEYNVEWDSSKTEAEFSKTPEDLLNGPKQVHGGTPLSQAPSREGLHEHSPSNEAHSIMSAPKKAGLESHQSPSPDNIKPLLSHDATKSSMNDNATQVSELKKEMRRQSSDALERAHTAIAAAERATAAARAAAQLVNVKFSTHKLEEPKS